MKNKLGVDVQREGIQLTVEIKVLSLALPWTKSSTLTNSFIYFSNDFG